MNLQQQEEQLKEFQDRMCKTIQGKGDDYANEDRLSNFKLAGNIAGLSPELNCLSLIATKVARLGVLLHGQNPNSESISDSILDLACYAVLLDMILREKVREASRAYNTAVKNISVDRIG